MNTEKALTHTFLVNRIAIIESLPSRELQTGRELAGYLNGQLEDLQTPISVSHVDVATPNEFRSAIANLAMQADREGLRPIVHIEAHGEDDFGLHFREGKIHWREICDALIPLNRASGFNLLLSVSACFGVSCISGVSLCRGAPCYALLGPSKDLSPSDLLNRFRSFYREIIHSQDLDLALATMNKDKLERGQMVFVSAEGWFEELMLEYLTNAAHPKELKAAAMRIFRKARSEGSTLTLGETKRQLVRDRPQIAQGYFAEFFMVNYIPENAQRFGVLLRAMEVTIKKTTPC
ncbi:hypothetical protein [Acidovorax radicis]|jgi:hypothetical protein|uniref:hypothetical protein n=1 Tax=Acidovorax radicis TaxID=758826 RepID=UPI001CF836B6|nr:hypothetical protein [Acidovorax radicis]UCU98333.1 hypothetical protein KI609_17705 [Acidovorax radicis]